MTKVTNWLSYQPRASVHEPAVLQIFDQIGEERAMRASLIVQQSHASNVDIIERAITTYDNIRGAILDRMAEGLTPGSNCIPQETH